ncbi:hypothetical protein [Streptomyces roseicoloratus]|uniref:hypothetical protein n=1 Tax=Streptomyces roseicoloratus TaxID=2508722 RepID=UPI0013E9167A|nr:hypothetical protein [Streptomyces roseicoloratus]
MSSRRGRSRSAGRARGPGGAETAAEPDSGADEQSPVRPLIRPVEPGEVAA